MRRFSLAIAAAAAMSACTTDIPESDQLLQDLENVKVGMSRGEVERLLGPYDSTFEDPPFPPVCDNFSYLKNNKKRFVQIWYDTIEGSDEKGVNHIITDAKQVCSVV